MLFLYILFFIGLVRSLPIKRDINVETVYETEVHTFYVTTTMEANSPAATGGNKVINFDSTQTGEGTTGSVATPSNQEDSTGNLNPTITPTSFASAAAIKSEVAASSASSNFFNSSYTTSTTSTKSSTDDSVSSTTPTAESLFTSQVPQTAFLETTNKLWDRFWSTSNSQWNDNDSICKTNSYQESVVWDQAILGKAMTNLKQVDKIQLTINNINKYKNEALGVYSASTAGDNDIYNDDNAQIAWVFIDAYKLTGNMDYLNQAKTIVSFLINQSDPNGGIIWKYQEDYIASISTVEAALAAIRLYTVTNDPSLLSFSENCMNFMFKYFQDPSDNLFYDGLNKNDYTDINKGKLSYTVGCALSTLAYLNKYSSNSTWLSKAIELGKSAINQNGAFYDGDKIWNNQLKYVHLLFAGFADLLNIVDWQDEFNEFKTEVIRQGTYIFNYLQDPDDNSLYFNSVTSTLQMFEKYQAKFKENISFSDDPSNHCNGDLEQPTIKNLIDNGSAAQILYELNRVI